MLDIQLLYRYKHKDMGDLEKGLQESQDGRSRSNFQITSFVSANAVKDQHKKT